MKDSHEESNAVNKQWDLFHQSLLQPSPITVQIAPASNIEKKAMAGSSLKPGSAISAMAHNVPNPTPQTGRTNPIPNHGLSPGSVKLATGLPSASAFSSAASGIGNQSAARMSGNGRVANWARWC
jgi:hypothetical protein